MCPTVSLNSTCPKLQPSSPCFRFLQPLRTYVLPFYPLVSDEDDFELSLYSFLEDVEGQMASKAGDDKVLLTQGRSAEAGLFLALLAVGIQFADLPNDEREDKAYNLSTFGAVKCRSRSSDQVLQLSDLLPVFAFPTSS